jgi:hypothetical protein
VWCNYSTRTLYECQVTVTNSTESVEIVARTSRGDSVAIHFKLCIVPGRLQSHAATVNSDPYRIRGDSGQRAEQPEARGGGIFYSFPAEKHSNHSSPGSVAMLRNNYSIIPDLAPVEPSS